MIQSRLAFWSVALGSILVASFVPDFARCDDPAVGSGAYRGVYTAVRFDVSPPLESMLSETVSVESLEGMDPPLQSAPSVGPEEAIWDAADGAAIPQPVISFDGPPNVSNLTPPSPVGAVGPNHYVVASFRNYAIYNKAGIEIVPPTATNTLWSGFGGDCETDPGGAPSVLYDQFADRWLLSHATGSGPTFFFCIAISTGDDPTGAYYRWAVAIGSNLPIGPKFGLWPNAYFISTEEYDTSFLGVGAYALERLEFLDGNPAARVVSFLVAPGGSPANIGNGLLPADLEGLNPPPLGSPGFFAGSMDTGGPYSAPQDALTLWKFDLDWNSPASSSFTLSDTIPVLAFDSIFPCSPSAFHCIPQPDTTNKVDVLSYRQRLLPRLVYRNFLTHESLVANQTVEPVPGLAGIRWYELRDPNGSPTIHQQGSYAPSGTHRWNGSIAMDSSGNIALGYSASDADTIYPSVWYTGRLASDPLGTLLQGEASLVDGSGSQTGGTRWGNYSSMTVDPADNCTFWYVNQYIPTTSSTGWQLRIGAFKFEECLPITPIFFDGFESGNTLHWSSSSP